MVKSMKPGSVIVDLAAVAGGNCSATKADQINVINKVSIVGFTNIPSRLAGDASRLFARNIYSFIENNDVYYEKYLTNAYLNLDKAYFILYNSNNVW